MSTTSTSPHPPSSPPPSISYPTTTTTNAHSVRANTMSAAVAAAAATPNQQQHFHSTLPTAETQRHVEEARAAVVASMGNMVDRELQSRAAVLHENARALDKQETDVMRATDALRREREKLGREVDGAARKLKEVGNVQNWAEVLERQFLVLEETVRLANGDGDSVSDGASSGSCSCSDCGKNDDEDGRTDGRGEGGKDADDDSRMKENGVSMIAMDVDGVVNTAWSDTSRSLNDPESSTGTGMAKGSETASVSTNS